MGFTSDAFRGKAGLEFATGSVAVTAGAAANSMRSVVGFVPATLAALLTLGFFASAIVGSSRGCWRGFLLLAARLLHGGLCHRAEFLHLRLHRLELSADELGLDL